jgi:hypothetical protein
VRPRPVRPNIYLPVVRFGVADSDWFTVLLISCAGYLLPVPLGMTVLYVPLQMWTWLLATAGSIAFFNYIRVGRKPRWLPHKLKAIFFHHRQYRALPNGKKQGFQRPWLVGLGDDEPSVETDTAESAVKTIRALLQRNRDFQEASEEKWNPISLTTN